MTAHRFRSRQSIVKRLAIVLAFATAGAWFPTMASAHVSVQPPFVAAGSTSDVVFTVPNERNNAATTAIEVVFPEDVDIAKVNAGTVSGWSSSVESDGDGVTSVAWEGGELSGETSEAFTLTFTAPTTVDEMKFSVLQTYSDGEIVRWIDSAPSDGSEAEHPAPLLAVSGATTTTTTEAPTTTTSAPLAPSANDEKGGTGIGFYFLGFGALVLVLVLARAKVIAKRQ